MASRNKKWSDLAVRLTSGVVMVVTGLWGVWSGGHVFHIMVAVVCGLMTWELARMVHPTDKSVAIQLGALAAAACAMATYLPIVFALPVLVAPALVGFGQIKEHRFIFLVFTVMLLLAGFGMVSIRDNLGFNWLLWLVLIVLVTDIFGYFAGRMLGGPKFWPSISPKKTWSGTVFGWIGAAGVGTYYMATTDMGVGLIFVSIAVSFASQIGDIAESAIKRRLGVKDSSNLIPGHGGLMDRFDGMLGASVFVLFVAPLFGFAPLIG